MSLGLEKLNLIETIDPRIDTQKLSKLLYEVENTGLQNTYTVYPVTNFSASNITVQCNPPNRDVMVTPEFFMNVIFQLTFTGTSAAPGIPLLQAAGLPVAAGVNPGNAYYDAPRANALSKATNTISVAVNGEAFSTNLNQYVRALERYHNDVYEQDVNLSYTPTMLDQSLQYSDLIGQARSELRGYGDNVLQCPRGAYQGALITRNDSTGLPGDIAQVTLNLTAPIYMSPFEYGYHRQSSFTQIDTINIIQTLGGRGNGVFGGLAGALWSHAVPSGLGPVSIFTNVNVSVLGANAIFQYISAPLTLPKQLSLVYPYVNPVYYATEQSAIAAGNPIGQPQVTSQLNLNNVQLNSVPNKVYIWVSKRDMDNTMNDTDTYLEIKNISITFNNQPGILSSADPQSLYRIATRNGCNESYRQFSYNCGSVLCLKFGEDIPLGSDLIAAGSRGSYNFSAQVTVANNYSSGVVPQVSALFIQTGTVTISNGEVMKNVGILTDNDVLNTKSQGGIPIASMDSSSALGAGFWSDFLNVFKRIGRTAINVAKPIVSSIAPQYSPVVEGADVLAKNLGFGKMQKARGGQKLSRQKMLAMMR